MSLGRRELIDKGIGIQVKCILLYSEFSINHTAREGEKCRKFSITI